MDGGVLARRVAPAHLLASPARAGDRACRQAHETAAETMGSDVDDVESIDAAGKIPAGDESHRRQERIEDQRVR
jgi:hypothetical protein